MKVKLIIPGAILLSLILLIGFIGWPIINRSEGSSPATRTRAKLNEISSWMRCYYIDKLSWPDPNLWQEQIVLYLNEQKFSSKQKNLFLDGWGNKFKYVVNDHFNKIQRFVYSFGQNGRDEGGEGDDRLIEIKLPPPMYEEGDPVTSTKKRLENFTLAFRVFFLDTGSWPSIEKWHQNIEKYLWEYYGDKFKTVQKYYGERAMFEGEYSIFRDEWGNNIRYFIDSSIEHPRRFLYSYGWNGNDDKMKGDDVTVEINEGNSDS